VRLAIYNGVRPALRLRLPRCRSAFAHPVANKPSLEGLRVTLSESLLHQYMVFCGYRNSVIGVMMLNRREREGNSMCCWSVMNFLTTRRIEAADSPRLSHTHSNDMGEGRFFAKIQRYELRKCWRLEVTRLLPVTSRIARARTAAIKRCSGLAYVPLTSSLASG
jgi:hypothetical protein